MGEINWGGLTWSEGFEGANGTALDTYDATYVVTKAGTSTVTISNTQKNTGSTSLKVYRDGANDVIVTRAISVTGGLVRCHLAIYYDGADNTLVDYPVYIYSTVPAIIAATELRCAGGVPSILIYYGNGAGGNLTLSTNISASAWHTLDIDLNHDTDKQRVWIDGVLVLDWSNYLSDGTATSISSILFGSDSGAAHTFYLDDLKFFTGWTQSNYLGSTPDPKAIPSTRSTPVPKPGGG